MAAGAAPRSLEATLILAVGMVSLAAHILLVGWPFLAQRLPHWRAGCRNARRVVVEILRPSVHVPGKDALEEHVARRMRVKMEQDMHTALRFFSMGWALVVATICYTILAQSQRWMSDAQTGCCLAALVVSTAATTCFSRFFVERPGVAYSLAMASFCGVWWMLPPQFIGFFVSEAASFFFRFMLSTRYHHLLMQLFWNFSYLGSAMSRSMLAFPQDASILLVFQVWNALVIVLAAVGTTRAIREDIRQDVETAALRGESTGLWNLLDLVCDVVVSMDGDLRITDKASRFAALVMMQNKNVEGMRLQDFMPVEEDRDLFERCAGCETPAHSDGTLPRALHVKLRDGLGNLIRVELFCVQAQTLDGRNHYVGIREFSDFAPLAEPKCFGSAASGERRGRARAGAAASGAPPLISRDVAGAAQDGTDACARSREGEVSMRTASSDGSASGDSDSGCETGRARPGGSRSRGRRRRGGAASVGGGSFGGAEAAVQTPDEAMQLALVRLMRLCSLGRRGASRWGSLPGERECCPFHLRTSKLQGCLERLDDMACHRKFSVGSAQQCGFCGFMVDPAWQLRCMACDMEARADSEVGSVSKASL